MKFLLLIVVVLAVLWYLRNNRRDSADRPAAGNPRTLAPPQDMVRCAVCAVHLPRPDALPGGDGRLYCCAEHRARNGG
jgi:uncharacterized protein